MLHRFLHAVFPCRGDSRRGVILKILSLAAFAVFVVCAVQIALYFAHSAANAALQRDLAKKLTSSAPSSASAAASSAPYPAGMLDKFHTLYGQNPDIRGAIQIPGTAVDSLPVVQTADNSYYLDHDFNRQSSEYGTLFLDYRDKVSATSLSKNLIIYGHNMKDGQMFHVLPKYQQVDFYKSAPVITFDTVYGQGSWKVFACFIANAAEKDGYVFPYLRTDFSSASDFMSFIKEVQARSLLNTSVDVQPADTILTLSTCTYEYEDARFVVMARKVRDGEDASVGAVSRNARALNPLKPMK